MRRLAILLLIALPAPAHVGDLFGGTDVLVALDGPGHGVAAGWGVAWSDGGGDYAWLCHDVVRGPEAFEDPAWITDGETWLGVVLNHEVARVPGEPVYRSTDRCHFEPVTGLTEARMGGLAFLPGTDGVVLASTAAVDEGAVNRLLRSTDAGATFVATDLQSTTGFFRDIAAPPTVAWMAEVRLDPPRAVLWRSFDAGLTWEGVTRELRAPDALGGRVDFLDVIAVDPSDDDRAWLLQGPIGGPDQVLLTEDGGSTATRVFDVPGDLLDAAVDDTGALWLCNLDGTVYHAPDGVNPLERDDVPRCGGIEAVDDRLVVLTRDNPAEGELVTSTDGGATWTGPVLLDALSGPADCPADSPAAQACPAAWDELLARLAPDDPPEDPSDDPPPDDPDDPEGRSGGCGPAVPPALAPLLLALLLPRRRRSAP